MAALSLTIGMAAAPLPAGTAHAEQASTDDVEAAYLYNFGKFVRWPQNTAHGPLVICLGERDSLGETLQRLSQGEQVNGRILEVRLRVSPQQAAGCSILFVGAGQRARMEEFLRATARKPVLTVSDAPDFLDRGGILQFVQVGDHLRFSANPAAAQRNGLSLSSELLKVAVDVRNIRAGKGGGQ